MAEHSLGVEHQHGWLVCPACGYTMDASSGVDPGQEDTAPVDGDCTVCIACAAVAIYEDGATVLRQPTADERGAFARDVRLQAAVQSVIELRDRAATWPKGPGR